MAILTLTSSKLSLSVDPELGGRVTSLTFDGVELLSSRKINPTNWGATFWTSPQADWGWPPVSAVDSDAYEVVADGSASAIVLRSNLATIGERQFHIEKRFVSGPADCIDVTYRIENVGATPFRMASWEISRVAAGGLTFFPTGDASLTPIAPHGRLDVEQQGKISWYDHRTFTPTPGQSIKLHADGKGGYLAHAIDGLLILKTFADMPPERQAPGEGEVELFANEDGKYVEIEVQGPHDEIPPGGKTDFTVRTHVCPAAGAAEVGSGALERQADELALKLASA